MSSCSLRRRHYSFRTVWSLLWTRTCRGGREERVVDVVETVRSAVQEGLAGQGKLVVNATEA
jgi:hypothetical protein